MFFLQEKVNKKKFYLIFVMVRFSSNVNKRDGYKSMCC